MFSHDSRKIMNVREYEDANTNTNTIRDQLVFAVLELNVVRLLEILTNHPDSLEFSDGLLNLAIFANSKKENELKDPSDIIEILVRHGVDINKHCPLQSAMLFDNESAARVILNYNPEINIYNAKHGSILHLAIKNDQISLALELLRRDARIDFKDESGNTALHLAIEAKAFDLVSELLIKGAGLNCQNNYGSTPLHFAVAANNKDILILLLKQEGINYFIEDNEKRKAVDWAARCNYEKMLGLILQKNIHDLRVDPKATKLFYKHPSNLTYFSSRPSFSQFVNMLALKDIFDDCAVISICNKG